MEDGLARRMARARARLEDYVEWAGVAEGGKPGEVALTLFRSSVTRIRAPAPGAIKKVEGEPPAAARLRGRRVALHRDSATTYEGAKVGGVLRVRTGGSACALEASGSFRGEGTWGWRRARCRRVGRFALSRAPRLSIGSRRR